MKRIMIAAALALVSAHAMADRLAIVSGGIVENVIDAPPGFTVPGKTTIPSLTAGVGDSYSGGKFTKPLPPVADVPQSVTPLQLRRALRKIGLHDAVKGYVATLDDDSRDAWEYATTFERNNPLLLKAAELLGKSSAEIDDLFRLAASL